MANEFYDQYIIVDIATIFEIYTAMNTSLVMQAANAYTGNTEISTSRVAVAIATTARLLTTVVIAPFVLAFAVLSLPLLPFFPYLRHCVCAAFRLLNFLQPILSRPVMAESEEGQQILSRAKIISFQEATEAGSVFLVDEHQLVVIRTLANLKGCSYLTDLSLFDYTGDLSDLAELTSLENLSLSYCDKITGSLSDLAGLTSLKYLSLSYCDKITGSLSDLAGLTSLKHLSLSHCNKITGNLPNLGNLTSLWLLWLSGCTQITGDLANLEGLTSLNSLNLSGCTQIGGNTSELKNLTSLWLLNLSGCTQIEGNACTLARLTSLVSFLYDGSGITGKWAPPSAS